MTSTEVLNSKNKIHDKIKLITDFKALWKQDLETKRFKLIVEGFFMEKGMGPGGLTAADKEWIANLVSSTVKTEIQAAVKPIQEDISSLKKDVSEIKDRLDVLEEDVAELKNDMSNVKEDIKAIKECPTIEKELKK